MSIWASLSQADPGDSSKTGGFSSLSLSYDVGGIFGVIFVGKKLLTVLFG
jgi:hypothetical protein